MNASIIATIIGIAEAAKPIITDLEAIRDEAKSDDSTKQKIQAILDAIEGLVAVILKAI